MKQLIDVIDKDPPRQAAVKTWLASLLLQQRSRLWQRFIHFYQHLCQLPRRTRRQWCRYGVQRRIAAGLVGAALLLALSRAPARAATLAVADGEVTINDNGICSLVEAIDNANDTVDGNVHDDCDAGNPGGADTITLPANGLFAVSYDYYDSTGLPPISSEITIDGNEAIIERDSNVSELRPLFVFPTGDLTLNDTTLRNGYAGVGGAVYVNTGSLTLNNCTITNNEADRYSNNGNGGAILNLSGNVTIANSVVSDNIAYRGGAIFNDEYDSYAGAGTITIISSTISGNESAYSSGGAIFNAIGTVTITNSILSENTADYYGGGVYNRYYGVLTITDSTLSNNNAYIGGGVSNYYGTTTITNSTLSSNTAFGGNGGGADNRVGVMTITNSTLSGNSTDRVGGGVSNSGGTMTITNSTVTGNTSRLHGGGIGSTLGTLTINRSLISGNTAGYYGDEVYDHYSITSITADNYNLFGHNGISNADAFSSFTPSGSDITATSDGTDPTPLASILSPLADNGGPTMTHLLVADSPALDTAPTGPATDQRGASRPLGAAYDTGAVEGTEPTGAAVFMSAKTPGTTDDGLDFGPEDIIKWDGGEWSMWFDGSDAGLMPMNAKHNINAFWIPDPAGDDFILSFAQNSRFVPDIGPKVDGMDLVHWNGSAFSLYFDGQDVGLTIKTQEKIDGLHILDGSESPIGSACLDYLLISTHGPGKVPNYSGGTLKFSGEDVLGFCATALGNTTAGLWHMVLDGSAQGMPKNSTDSISLSEDGNTLYLTTRGTFNVDLAAGSHSMVYTYDFTTQEFNGPVFSAPANGLDKMVDGLHVEGDLP